VYKCSNNEIRAPIGFEIMQKETKRVTPSNVFVMIVKVKGNEVFLRHEFATLRNNLWADATV